MVTIRLSRTGAKKKPFYHIVVADSRYKRDGRYIERIGFYNPGAKGNEETMQAKTFNKVSDGDLRQQYYNDKWKSYPPNQVSTARADTSFRV